MARFKLALSFVLCLVWCLPGLAQQQSFPIATSATVPVGGSYTGSLIESVVPTYSQCGSANCWQVVANTPSLIAFSESADGDKWGINTSNQVMHFDSLTGWTVIAFSGTPKQIVASVGATYLLSSTGKIFQYTGSGWGSNKFTPYPATFRQISVGTDGDLWALGEAYGCAYHPYHYNPSSGTWTAYSRGLTVISVKQASDVWGVCTGIASPADNVFNFNGSAWTAQAGWLNNIQAAPDGTLWGTNGGSTFMRYETGSTNWTNLVGTPSLQTSAGEDQTYGLFGNTLEKFQAFTIQFTHNLTGSFNAPPTSPCTPGPNPCPPPIPIPTHYGPITLAIAGHTAKVYNLSTLSTTPINVNVSDTLTPAEAYQCMTAGNSCPSVSVSTQLKCTAAMLASLLAYEETFMDDYFERAYTLVKYPIGGDPAYSCVPDSHDKLRCKFNVITWCTPDTTVPDSHPSWVLDYSDKVFQPTYWNTWKICMRLRKTDPWFCSPLNIGDAQRLVNGVGGLSDNYAKAHCTKTN
jgi:hypothetical protein